MQNFNHWMKQQMIHHTSNNMLSITLIYRQEVASLFQVQGKFKVCKNSK